MTLNATVAGRLLAAGLEPEDTERVVRGALDEDLRYGPDLTSAATAARGPRAVAGVFLVWAPPQVTFAGLTANVVWAGSAPGLIAGATQIQRATAGEHEPGGCSGGGVASPPAPIRVVE